MLTLVLALPLSGCDDERSTALQDHIDTTGVYAPFDPAQSVIPFPNDLLFSGSTDGTLNTPTEPGAADSAVKAALNALDGFSTLAPIRTALASDVAVASVVGGDSVRLFEVTLSGTAGGVAGITRELAAGADYAIGLDNAGGAATSLSIHPVKPLRPKTAYMVVLTRAIQDSRGKALAADLTYAIAKSPTPLVDGAGVSLYRGLSNAQARALEALRQRVNAAEQAVSAAVPSVAREDIILSWTFTTQSIADTLVAVRNTVRATPPPVSRIVASGADSPGGVARIYVGSIDLPYYSSAPTDSNPGAPLRGHWQGLGGTELTGLNPMPVATSVQSVPLLLSVPKIGNAPWPVVIYQHGITRNRTDGLAVADSLGQAGFAVVAIDLPLHGLSGRETDGTQAFYTAGGERSFALDVLDNATGVESPDGLSDDSGSHFINLRSLLTTRDNLRQGVADLFSLREALKTMDFDGGGADFDVGRVRFLGHSLGAIVGAVFVALDDSVGAASLVFAGGGLAKLLDGSATFGPVIANALAANGLIKGHADYESFMTAAQTVIDSGDALNYADGATVGRGLQLLEIVGGHGSLADQVVPNNVLAVPGTQPSASAGTDPLARAMGLTVATASQNGDALRMWLRFSAGHHGSLLTPHDALGHADPTSALVMREIQSEVASFLASNGTLLTVNDPSLLAGQ
jgi:pimeloyl-ACP methyl ester carboxylesterase